MDPFGTGQTLPPLQLPQTAAPPATVNPLKKPPKWIRRPVGASFAVGPVSPSFNQTHRAFSTLGIILLCFLLVWWEADIFGEHKAEPPAASAAHCTRRAHQPGGYRNSVPEALRPAAGRSELRQLRGSLPGEDRRSRKRV